MILSSTNWDSSEITSYIWGWVSSIATFLCSVTAAILILVCIKIGFKIAKAGADGEVETRSKYLNSLIWVAIGFIICCTSATICGLLANSLLK